MAIQIRLFETISGALAQAITDRAMTGSSHWSNPSIGGVDPQIGQRFVVHDMLLSGYDARGQ
ncbi:hypothetical protein HY522_08200 [bacterium]|nr:hypothetical protein [bacterium]